MRGAVAAGHVSTAEAGNSVLRSGGNAFDAALAALAAACVVEPVLASLGGGGFLLARPASGAPVLYDFFVQTPSAPRDEGDLDFRPILADFGGTTQEFHIGHGTVAVPGTVRGIFEAHGDLGTMPLAEVLAPAVELARRGVEVTPFQAYLFQVVKATFVATEATRRIFGSRDEPGDLVRSGERLVQPELADALEALALEGEDLFYRGEMAAALADDMVQGGWLTRGDLESYRMERRPALELAYRGCRILTNPPPASGGLLVGFGLDLLERFPALPEHGSAEHVICGATVLELTGEARIQAQARSGSRGLDDAMVLDPGFLARYRREVLGRVHARRGTTHISVIDADGNLASLTVSNGEGSGYVIPGTGIVMNNMLGEEDLNPGGFHRWPLATRMTSMMCPTALAWPDGRMVAIGSGGSNRIRTAILQVLSHLVDHRMDVEAAVHAPRIHFERGLLSVEGGYDEARIAPALEHFPEHHLWDRRNLFFGGAHTVLSDGGSLRGAGDERRAGVCMVA